MSPQYTVGRWSCVRLKCEPEGAARALTLIELLVVIAIVTILALLAIPFIGRARESAHTAACASNLRNIYYALSQFAHDNDGRYPKNGNDGPTEGHNFAERLILHGYMPRGSGVWGCPADPGQDFVRSDKELRSYAYIFPAMSPDFQAGERRLMAIHNPGRVTMITEYHSQRGSDALVVDNYAGSVVGYDIVSTDKKAEANSGHHNGRRNFLFFDGHVTFFAPAEVRHLDPRNRGAVAARLRWHLLCWRDAQFHRCSKGRGKKRYFLGKSHHVGGDQLDARLLRR